MFNSAQDQGHRPLFIRQQPDRGYAPTAQQQQVLDHDRGRLRVLAGPGTGKTATLVHAVAHRVARGIDPATLLVLSYSRRAMADVADRLYPMLNVPVAEPLVRTIHGFCYALVRQEDIRAGRGQPRLTAAGEASRMVAELLAGQLADGGGHWPAHLRPALAVPGFAERVRQVMAACIERGITPHRLTVLAERHKCAQWHAIAQTMRDYQQVVDLRAASTGGGLAYDQTELIRAALDLLRIPAVFNRVRQQIRRIFVDEYQDVDPAQAALIDQLATGADELVVFGDPDQSVYAFRGADPRQLAQLADSDTVLLTDNLRSAPQLVHAVQAIAAGLPGDNAHRRLRAVTEQSGTVQVLRAPSMARQAALIADALHRAHLVDQLPWSQMAVICRSMPAILPALRRACQRAGIPLAERAGVELGQVPLVTAMLAVLGYPHIGLTEQAAQQVLASDIGDLPTLAQQRLVRSLPVGQQPLVDLLTGDAALPPGLPRSITAAVRRIRQLLTTSVELAAAPADRALWELWQASGLPAVLVEHSGNSSSGRRADIALDAMLALSDIAQELVTANPGATAAALVAAVAEVGSDQLGPGRSDAVTVLTAHAAKGLEWELVVVAGVQEGSWPSPAPVDGLLRLEQLVDAHAGFDSHPGQHRAHLADQRRLFYVACSRARRRLVVTAVDNGDDLTASRFVTELSEAVAAPDNPPAPPGSLADLVAELRRAVVDPQTSEPDQLVAAGQLARLARAQVPGADPATWYGVVDVSTQQVPHPDGEPVVISPSTVEAIVSCPLRGALRSRMPARSSSEAQFLGQALHTAADLVAKGMAPEHVRAELAAATETGPEAPWQRRRQQRLLAQMLDQVAVHAAARAAAGQELIGTEIPVTGHLPAGGPGEPAVTVRGRIDRLTRAADGTGIVTDLKTGQTVPSVAKAQQNPQLATYQYLLADGAVPEVTGPGGAELWLVRTSASRTQPPLQPAQTVEVQSVIRSAAAAMVATDLSAIENDQCPRCEVRTCCPLQPDGREVT